MYLNDKYGRVELLVWRYVKELYLLYGLNKSPWELTHVRVSFFISSTAMITEVKENIMFCSKKRIL